MEGGQQLLRQLGGPLRGEVQAGEEGSCPLPVVTDIPNGKGSPSEVRCS